MESNSNDATSEGSHQKATFYFFSNGLGDVWFNWLHQDSRNPCCKMINKFELSTTFVPKERHSFASYLIPNKFELSNPFVPKERHPLVCYLIPNKFELSTPFVPKERHPFVSYLIPKERHK